MGTPGRMCAGLLKQVVFMAKVRAVPSFHTDLIQSFEHEMTVL